MKRLYFIVTALAALALLASACSPQATPTAAPPADTAVPTAAASASSAMAGEPANVMVGTDATLGSFLVDAKGMSLYLFTKDTPNTSNCYDKCATAWPPLLTTGAPVASDGLDTSKLGTTTRTDGTTQVTFNGWPLYYYAKDLKPGDVTGQNVGTVWFVVSPAGDAIGAAPASSAAASAGASASGGASVSAGAAVVTVATDATLGTFLVDMKGMSLYLYTKDTPNTSNCYGKCATAWPPLLTNGASFAGAGADASKLGTTTRTDGTTQVTYNGWPLYYYVKDLKPGDVTGQNVGTVWFVVSPAGEEINK